MFFSVNVTTRILGKNYIPCVCYNLKESLKATVQKLEADGKATIYKDRVYFQSGEIIPTQKKLKKTVRTKEDIVNK